MLAPPYLCGEYFLWFSCGVLNAISINVLS